ncbi:MAG: hypothetical protein ABJG42_24170 [Vibrio splendidus]
MRIKTRMFYQPDLFDRTSINKIIRRLHPDYSEMYPHWKFLEASYRGGPTWFKENVFRYMKEGDKEYSDRVKRAYRFNHTREVVDLVNKYLFRTPPRRNLDNAPQSLINFWENSSINGLSMDEFARAIALQTSVFGRVWVVVDTTAEPLAVRTVAQEKRNKERVYAYIVKPADVIDLSYDDDRVLNWVLIRERVRDDNNPLDSTGRTVTRYRLWTRNQWFLFGPQANTGESLGGHGDTQATVDADVNYEVVDYGDHDIGVVPVVPADNMISDELYTSPSLVSDVSYLDRAVANYASNLDAIIQDQTFSQLAMPAQGLLPGDDEYQKLLELGTKRIFIYDGEGGSQPFFLSPDPRQAALISTAINQIIGEIYHSVGLGNERSKDVATENTDKASGVAKTKDFERVSALLKSKADSMTMVENSIVNIVCRWTGQETPKERLVEYPTSFNTRELFDEFYIAQQMSLVQMPPQIRGEQMKSIVDKLFPKISTDLKEQMAAEIDDWAKQEEKLKEATTEQGLQTNAENGTAKLAEEAKRNRSEAGVRQSRSKEKTGDSKKSDSPN